MGYYADGHVWTCQSVRIEGMAFSLNERPCKLIQMGSSHRVQCDWFDTRTLKVAHLRPRAVSWIAAALDGSPSMERIVWVRGSVPLNEAEWGGNPAVYPVGFDMLETIASGSASVDEKLPEPWQHKVVKIGEDAKLLQLLTEPSDSFTRAAVAVLAAACLLLERRAPSAKLPAEASFEDYLRIIMQYYYHMHAYEPGEFEADPKSEFRAVLLADHDTDQHTLMQRYSEAVFSG